MCAPSLLDWPIRDSEPAVQSTASWTRGTAGLARTAGSTVDASARMIDSDFMMSVLFIGESRKFVCDGPKAMWRTQLKMIGRAYGRDSCSVQLNQLRCTFPTMPDYLQRFLHIKLNIRIRSLSAQLVDELYTAIGPDTALSYKPLLYGRQRKAGCFQSRSWICAWDMPASASSTLIFSRRLLSALR